MNNNLMVLRKALTKLGFEDESEELPFQEEKDIDPCSGGIVFFDSDGSIWSSHFDDEFIESNEQLIFETAETLFKNSGIRMMFRDEFFCFYVNNKGESIGTLVFHQEPYNEDYKDEDDEYDQEDSQTLWFSRVVSPNCSNRGIAKIMLRTFIEENRGSIIKSETWNRKLDRSLLEMGFKEEKRTDRTNGELIIVHSLYPGGYIPK
jgi:hypothetical protein